MSALLVAPQDVAQSAGPRPPLCWREGGTSYLISELLGLSTSRTSNIWYPSAPINAQSTTTVELSATVLLDLIEGSQHAMLFSYSEEGLQGWTFKPRS